MNSQIDEFERIMLDYLKGEISEENKLLEETMSNAVVSPNVLSLPNREL